MIPVSKFGLTVSKFDIIANLHRKTTRKILVLAIPGSTKSKKNSFSIVSYRDCQRQSRQQGEIINITKILKLQKAKFKLSYSHSPKHKTMKKTAFVLLAGILCITACKKSNSSSGNSTFSATVNGKATTFNVVSATLLRSQPANEKRMDITGISADKSQEMIITLGLETSLGSGMTVKSYVLNPFPPDDPNTPNIDESLTTQGYTTYMTSLGNGSWFTDVYDEQGTFVISACDSAHTTVSGTFETTLTDSNASPAISVVIKDGEISNLKYQVLN